MLEVGGEGHFRSSRLCTGRDNICDSFYILFRHIRRDKLSLPQPRLGPWIVDGKYMSIVPIETVLFVAMRSHGIRALEMKL